MPRVKVPVPVQVADPVEPVNEVPRTAPRQRFSKEQLLFAAVGAVFLVLIIMLASVMHSKNQLETKVNKLSTNTAASSANEVKKLTDEIGAVFQLPTGETPTLATVSDAAKVKNQAFFKNAQNGDKVLLYSKAGEAILYRPSIKKIISVAPVNLNGSSTDNGGSSATNGATSTTK
ncbi:MAG: hypothetical protein JWO41_889 [Candidatus Saccharibacteria bacterium]|nr:hypothetical protein [Candidatus Saccharibacteria bacterium]